MEKKCINVSTMPKAGPYSHAVKAGDMIFVSGAVPVNVETGEEIRGDIKKATAQILENIKVILAEAGSGLDKVVKTTVFLIDMADFSEMNEAYKTYFTENQPARSCVAVKTLPVNFEVEIEVIALA